MIDPTYIKAGTVEGDLISRQAAIEVIDAVMPVDPNKSEYASGIACGAALAMTYVKQLPSAQPETHEKRTETHACDCISRQDAITAIQNAYCDTEGGEDKCAVWKNVGLTNALHIMQDLPSAQPIQTASNYLQSLPTSPLLVGKMPSAQPEPIRCKDCKWYEQPEHRIYENCVRWKDSNSILLPINPDDFCSRAERREE